MSESKIYMFPDNLQNNAAMWAALANKDLALPLATMMNGGMNGMWNNPFIYLVWMMFAGRFFGNGWNGDGALNVEILGQLASLRDQMNGNLNTNLLMDGIKGNTAAISLLSGQLGCDFNALNGAICDVRSAVDKVASAVGFSSERVINAVNAGDCQISRLLSECCCNIRDAVTRLGYENQLAICNLTNTLSSAINTVANGLERGFSNLAYETQRLTCDITKAIGESTAAILAGQKAAEMRELLREIQTLRDERNAYQASALSLQQTQNIVNQIKPCPIPAYITCNPYSGDNYLYGCNQF